MKQKRLVAALLTLVLLAGLTAAQENRAAPRFRAAPLQSTFKQDEADLGQGETASLQSAPVMKREAPALRRQWRQSRQPKSCWRHFAAD